MTTHTINPTRKVTLMLASAALVLGATSFLAAQDSVTQYETHSVQNARPPHSPQFRTTSATGLRSGGYIGVDAGVNVVSDFKHSGRGFDYGISLEPGIRFDIQGGYAFKLADTVTFGLELETGYLYNTLERAHVRVGKFTASGEVSGDYFQVPLLVNGKLNWQFAPGWVAYGGGGVGVDFLLLDTPGVLASSNVSTIGSETDFAWQALGGIHYSFGNHELGVGYKYLAVKPQGLSTQGNHGILLTYAFHF